MIPDIAKSLFDAFESHGEELYLVGGSVRDYVMFDIDHNPRLGNQPMGQAFEPKDLDFATSAKPEKIAAILRACEMPVYPIGVEFGTIGSRLAQFPVEITTYRCKESYKKGCRKPAVVFGTSLVDDLKRRDFTVNAMAMDATGAIQDPFCGRLSCAEGVLLTPSEDPTDAFMDDPLRMLRAYRFESQLDLTLHNTEHETVTKLKNEIHTVSAERIFQEMSKLLLGQSAGDALRHMGESGLLGEIFPDLQTVINFQPAQGKWHSKRVWPHVIDVVDNSPRILEVRWAALFHDIAKPMTYSETPSGVHFYEHEPKGATIWNEIADKLKVSCEFKREVNYLIYHHLRFAQLCSVFPRRVSTSALRRFIRDCGPYLENLYLLSLADITSHHPDVVKAKRDQCIALKQQLDELIRDCDVRKLKLRKGLGAEIAVALNLPHGPELGRIMRHLNDQLIAGTLTEDADFIEAAREVKRKQDGLRELVRLSEECGGYDELKGSRPTQ